MKISFDVDIDMANRDKFLELVKVTPASIERDGIFTKHNTGVYFQNIPKFPIENISTIDHKKAEEDGWLKIDFLNNSIYDGIKNEEHLNKLLNTEPMWELLEHKEVVEKLFHISNYYSLVSQYKPQSVEQLAMILAIIRPGKKYLQGKTWNEISEVIWQKPDDGGYYFKHAHAVAYAVAIIVQLNLLVEQSGDEH